MGYTRRSSREEVELSHEVEPSVSGTGEPSIARELEAIPYEPLLPIEKKLIAGCLLLGVLLLGLLLWASATFFPVAGPEPATFRNTNPTRQFWCCAFWILPRGGRTYQPRASPGEWEFPRTTSPERAQQGVGDVAPLSGTGECVAMVPGRCPGLICGWLLRGEYTRSPLQICWLLNDVAEFRDAPTREPVRRLSLRERMVPFAERKATLGWRRVNSATSKLARRVSISRGIGVPPSLARRISVGRRKC
jgi:hypothetical protein